MKWPLWGCFLILLATVSWACNQTATHEVVVYTSVDDVFARPIAESFELETGMTVRLVPDTEETKSTGLLNRLIAEKARPQADVFWSGDPVRAAMLKMQDVSAPYRSPQAQGLPAHYSDPEKDLPRTPAKSCPRTEKSAGAWQRVS